MREGPPNDSRFRRAGRSGAASAEDTGQAAFRLCNSHKRALANRMPENMPIQ